MPHFIIECSEDVIEQRPADEIMSTVYEAAEASELFAPNDIKVRIQPYALFKLAEGKNSFLHVFGYIMQGRTAEQKASLSKAVIQSLDKLLPELSILSMNVSDFEAAAYCNKSLVHPGNQTRDRHFLL